MARKAEKKGLGRGLSALLADVAEPEAQQAGEDSAPRKDLRQIPIEKIAPNPDQPRRHFAEAELDELASSIRERGVLQPLILRPDPSGAGRFQIVAGERRWRAAQKAKLHELPAIVRELDDATVLEIAIIENIQRADLNPVEEARAFRQLMEKFGHTQEKLAEGLGKSRSHIANLLRLLTLPDSVLDHITAGRLTAGHARALVTSPEPEALARIVIDKGLSVRQTEALAKAPLPGRPVDRSGKHPAKDADTRALEADLTANLRLKVSIDHKSSGSGELRIRYTSLDELDGLCQLLSK
ncbi:MAG: ParB/RepB/Spo0J family partition protein [Rubricella sp.]